MKTYVIVLGMVLCAVTLTAQRPEPYMTVDELPNAVNYLPAPPDTGSIYFFNDWARYNEGLGVRGTERGEQAISDSHCNVDDMARYYSEVMGVEISRSNTPALYKFLGRVHTTVNISTYKAKDYYKRRRPFMVFNQSTSTPEQERFLRPNGSYPSGHTAIGWGIGLAMIQLAPERAEAILRLAYEFGQSRTIVGAHFQSDVDAGRLTSSAAFAAVQANEEYLADFAAAREEYLSKRK